MPDLTPRRWQAEALPVVASTLRAGRPALVSACTGAGKSIFLALLLLDLMERLQPGHSVVVTVPTESLVEQLASTLAGVLGSRRVGRWYGRIKRRRVVTVCCLPSLAGLVADLRLAGERCALWVGDEAHRAEAYAETIAALDPRCRLGVTATPYRSDTGLTMWPELTYRYAIDDAIADGALVPLDVRRYPGRADPVDVTTATIEMIHEHGALSLGPGIVSARDVADAEECAAELAEAGISAAPIHSRLPKREQAALISDLQAGRYAALVHVRMLSEGVDLPWLRWLALRTSHSRTRLGLVQEVGRVVRTHPGKPSGLVLDPLWLTYDIGLDHTADLDTDPDRETPRERERREARELIQLEREAEKTRRRSELDEWLAQQRIAALGPSRTDRGTDPPTPGQVRALERYRKATRWLQGDDRMRVKELLEGELTARTAGDLIAVLRAASEQMREHRAAGGSWQSVPRFGFRS